MAALDDLREMVLRMVRADAALITATDAEAAIGLALTRHSSRRPRTLFDTAEGEGSDELAVPTGWVAGESRLLAVEILLADGKVAEVLTPPRCLPDEGQGGWVVRLSSVLPLGQPARIRFTTPHTPVSLPEREREPVAVLAAAHLMDQLAASRSGDIDTSIGAAAREQASSARLYADRAEGMRGRYRDIMEFLSRYPSGGGVVVHPGSGRNRLTHPGRQP